MASAAGNSGSFTTTLMQRIDGELICGICLELFKSPVMLTCGHNFCKECVYGIIENGMHFSFISIGPPNSFNCPICQAPISINRVTKEGLMSNKALESIVELYKTCSPVDVFDSSWNTDLEVTPTICKMHDKTEDRFCDSCSVSICVQCERFNHQSYKAKHRVGSLKHAAISYQTEVADVLTKLKKELIPLNDKINQLEGILCGIQDNQEHVSKRLEHQISLLMSLIRQQQEQLKHTLDNEMQTRQLPVTVELEKCRAVKTNIQELMKKLSNIRNTKNPTLQLKLMKDTCVQLRAVLSFDIPECLQTFHMSHTEMPNWDLDTQHVTNTIQTLYWQCETPKTEKTKLKDTGIQTDIIVSDEGQRAKKVRVESVKLAQSPSPKQARTDRSSEGNKKKIEKRKNLSGLPDLDGGAFDEIDGNFPHVSKEVDKESVKMKEIILGRDTEVTQSVEEIKLLHSSDKPAVISGDDDLNETFKALKLEDRKRNKGRSSFPMDNSPQLNGRKVGEMFQKSAVKTKKSYSDKDLNKGDKSYSPTNAEALAKFVARRRTMSPSISSPSLKTLEQPASNSEDSEIKTRKNTSSPSLKSLNALFSETDHKEEKNISRPLPSVTHFSEKFGPRTKDEKSENSSLKSEKDIVPSNSTEKLPVNTSATEQVDRDDMTVVSLTHTETSTTKDNNVSNQPKPFSKKPIGMNLDLHLAHHEESTNDECKRVTEV